MIDRESALGATRSRSKQVSYVQTATVQENILATVRVRSDIIHRTSLRQSASHIRAIAMVERGGRRRRRVPNDLQAAAPSPTVRASSDVASRPFSPWEVIAAESTRITTALSRTAAPPLRRAPTFWCPMLLKSADERQETRAVPDQSRAQAGRGLTSSSAPTPQRPAGRPQGGGVGPFSLAVWRSTVGRFHLR